MKRNLHLKPRLATLVLAVAALPAVASSDCDAPAARWQSRDAVRPMAAQQGWQVTGVDIEPILRAAEANDNAGNRRKKIRETLFEQLGIQDAGGLFTTTPGLFTGSLGRS